MSGTPIRLVIVDDHPLVRRGLCELFAAEGDIDVVDAVGNGDEAVRSVLAQHPDVVLMDVSMPDIDGIEATRRVLAVRPETRVVMLTSFAEHERVIEALDSGAIGYILKDAESDELVRGVRAAAAGDSPLSPRAARALVTARRGRRPFEELTARELDVLKLVARGLSNKQIAWRLAISEKTVKTHMTSIFGRIGVGDRTQAAQWAQRHGVM
jgi:DNA-binding NarL/FixJ family response regulator